MVSARVIAPIATVFMLAAGTALAKPATVFMLQFGSFESKEEADARIKELKGKHSGIVGQLPTRVLEVSLPDNLTVYRTQAGPVPSRSDAQGLCGQLASTGDECYVVETAMTDTPGISVASSAPASQPKQLVAGSSAGNDGTTINTKNTATPALSTIDESGPHNANTTSTLGQEDKSISPNAQSKPVSMPNVRKLETAPPVTTTMAATPSAAAKTSVSAEPKNESSFWSHLNPFSDDEDEKPVAKAPEAPKPTAAPVASVETVDTTPIAQAAPAPLAASVVEEKRSSVAKPDASIPLSTPLAAKAETRQTVALPEIGGPSTPITVASSQSSGPLLPPPPPLTDRSKAILQQNVNTPVTTPAPVPVEAKSNMGVPTPTSAPAPLRAQNAQSVSTSQTPFAPASAETLQRLGKPAPVAGSGEVRVGEAQRVPLSSDNGMFVPSGSKVAPPDASTNVYPAGIQSPTPPLASPEVALPPSEPMGKTLWAEIGYFADAPSALSFWEGFRGQHPDFPVVRVRVTQSYLAKRSGGTDVTLRVGPFAKEQSIAYLCGSLKRAQEESDKRLPGCRKMTDLGISAGPIGQRNRVLLGEENARRALAQSTVIPDQYHLQLGSFPTMSQAENRWEELKRKHGNSLPGTTPDISVPAIGSTAAPVYRLRSGPFTSQTDALAACNMVKNGGGQCIVSAN